MRAVVVGASSGLGRSIGIGLAANGAKVALLARRKDRLEGAAEAAGNGALAIACDVTDAGSCGDAIEQAAAGLGGIDTVIYAAAVAPLARIAETDIDTWHWAFDTNVIGASILTSAALPHLKASGGKVIYLSSVSASQTAPWPGLGAYIVSKAALDKLVEVWRVEHPSVGFTRLVVGDCAGGEGESMTEMGTGWDPALAGEFGMHWYSKGLVTGTLMPVEELVTAVDNISRMGPGTSMPTVIVTPRPPELA